MKAWRFYAFGDMRLDDIEFGPCPPDHVLVEPMVVQPSVTEAQLAFGIPTLAYENIKRRLATDAPLLPTQIKRLVTRTALGLARIGGMGYNGSGDIFIGFSTANRSAAAARSNVVAIQMLPNDGMNALISSSVHATEEAILNAMLAAETLTGINGYTVPALPQD